jgi:hypothetical protein
MNEIIVGLVIGAETFATILIIYWLVATDKKIKGNQVIPDKIFDKTKNEAIKLSEGLDKLNEELKVFKPKSNE